MDDIQIGMNFSQTWDCCVPTLYALKGYMQL